MLAEWRAIMLLSPVTVVQSKLGPAGHSFITLYCAVISFR